MLINRRVRDGNGLAISHCPVDVDVQLPTNITIQNKIKANVKIHKP